VIKCAVCGSENEAAALFCGTCGSPLAPVDTAAIADEAAKAAAATTPEPDEAVVPGKDRGARRDLGIGTDTQVVTDTVPKPEPEVIADQETTPGAATITCGVCGTVNDATRTYCRKCANELKPAAPPPPPPPPPPAGRKISPLALGLGAAAIVVAIALVAVLLMGGKPGATLPPSAQASAGASSAVVEPTDGATSEPSVLPTPTARTFTEGDPSGQIAFTRCPSDGSHCSIYIRPADLSAKAVRVIGATNANASDPAISPDGKKIMYRVEPGLRLVTIATRTFVQHSTGPGDTNPAWSRDGTQIVFAGHRDRDNSGDDLEIRIDGLKSSSTSKPLTDNDVMDHDPVFSKDGKSVIYVQGEGDERNLEQVTIASLDIKDLTSDAFEDVDPAVSPDGTELVFASKRGGDHSEFDLFLLNLATLEVTELPASPGDEHDPDWSPGGRYIVYSGGPNGAKDLFILDLADMSTSTFTTGNGSDLTPSWR
jgi:Tol biopolymer transport system component